MPSSRPAPRRSLLLPWCAALLLAASAQAQGARPSGSVYALLRASNGSVEGDLSTAFDRGGVGLNGEVGYLVSERLAVGVGLWRQDLPAIRGGYRFAGRNRQGTGATQLQALARLRPLAPLVGGRLDPFVELGLALVSGQGTEDERNDGPDRGTVFGYGPVLGLGADVALTPRLSLFLGAQSTVVVPDVALDGADPSAFADAASPPPGALSDSVPYDVLTNLSLGVRFALRDPAPPARVESLACPAELETGAPGRFTVVANADAVAPVRVTWAWDDGATDDGPTVAHTYDAPGAYTVTATVANARGDDARTCLVTVTDPPAPPSLAACRVAPATADAGHPFTFDADVAGAGPVAVTVGFGDGQTATDLPAEHAFEAAGTYEVTITADSPYGTDACTVEVAVGDPYCSTAELGAVRFGYGTAELMAGATARLDANVEAFARCAASCVVINGYADGSEPGDALGVSQARADAVRQYYLARGVDAVRLRAVGRGVALGANAKQDPGPGDSRARRTDSVLSRCGRF